MIIRPPMKHPLIIGGFVPKTSDTSAKFSGAQALNRASTTQLKAPPASAGFAIACWVRPDKVDGTLQRIYHKADAGVVASDEYGLQITNGTNAWAFFFTGGAVYGIVTSPVIAVQGVWHFIECEIARDNINSSGAITVYPDQNPLNKVVSTAGAAGIPPDKNAAFHMGKSLDAGGLDNGFFTGLVDSVGVWRRQLTGAQADELHNSGAGRRFTTLPADVNDAVVWWELDERSGSTTWKDVQSANNLTAQGTVLSGEKRHQP